MRFIQNIRSKISKWYQNKKGTPSTMVLIAIIVAIIAIVYSLLFLFIKTPFHRSIKEGYDKQMNAFNDVNYIVFSPKPGYYYQDNWLHIGELEIYDQNGQEISYDRYTISTSNGIYQNRGDMTTDKLADKNIYTMFHSGNVNCTLTITLKYPTRVSRIYIRQRPDCCQNRMRGYKLLLQNSSQSTLAEIDLASSWTLFNSSYSDTFNFIYPVDPQIAILQKTAAENAAIQAASVQAAASADKAKMESSTTVDSMAKADELAKAAKIDSDAAEQTMQKAKDIVKGADEDYAAANYSANNANSDLNKANKISSEFQKQVDDAISISQKKIAEFSASITPRPKPNDATYNYSQLNQL